MWFGLLRGKKGENKGSVESVARRQHPDKKRSARCAHLELLAGDGAVVVHVEGAEHGGQLQAVLEEEVGHLLDDAVRPPARAPVRLLPASSSPASSGGSCTKDEDEAAAADDAAETMLLRVGPRSRVCRRECSSRRSATCDRGMERSME